MSDSAQPDLWMFSLEAVRATMLASVNEQIKNLNSNLKIIYLNGFRVWASDVELGYRDASNPPEPPRAYVVGTDDAGWPAAVQGDQPVTPMPPLPKPPTPTPVEIPPSALSAMLVPPGDTFPVGTVITAPDGSRWRKTESATPFGGLVRYYVKLAA